MAAQRGHAVTECADPGGTMVGQVIRGLLLDHDHPISLTCEALLFMASRAQLVAEVIRPRSTPARWWSPIGFSWPTSSTKGMAAAWIRRNFTTSAFLPPADWSRILTIVLDLPLAASPNAPQSGSGPHGKPG